MKALTTLKSKAGQAGLGGLQNLVLLLVVVGITLTIGAYVVNQVKGKMTSGTTAETVANDTENALGDISGWFAIIVIVVIAVIIIGLIVRAFQGRR